MDDDAFARLLRDVAALPDPTVPERIDRFEITGELGRGGFGVVYEARDRELGRHVAIKMLRPVATCDEQNLLAEAAAVARLAHPHIVTLFDFGRWHGRPYLVFERLRGRTLDRRLLAGPCGLADAVDIACAILHGLDHAHRAGLIHRDIKPSNVFLVEDGPVKLLDFGMAVARGGTAGYMAPEQIDGREDARSDLFATGKLLLAMAGDERALGSVIARATAPDPAERYADAGEMRRALLALLPVVDGARFGRPARLNLEHAEVRRRAAFVGRAREREQILDALSGRHAARIWFVHGIAGIGKTTLLGELARVAADAGVATIRLDGRDIEARPDGFLRALGTALDVPSDDQPLDTLCAHRRPQLVLVDRYEALAPLDAWMRDWLLPRLPERVVVVLAGRDAPALEWLVDPAWRDLVAVMPLRELSSDDSRELLARRGVDEGRRTQLIEFARGHPLALALAADVVAQHAELAFDREQPDLVQGLVHRFREGVPSPRHRDALEAAAIPRYLTEPLLASLLETPAGELFDWLGKLAFTTRTSRGLALHDLVRELLVHELRWRAPERHAELVGRAHASLMPRLAATSARELLDVTCDLMFVHGAHPAVAQFSAWQGTSELAVASATPRDVPEVLALVERHEGSESAGIAAHWLERQLDGLQVIRDRDGIAGFVATIVLTGTRADELARDPATRNAREELGALPPGGLVAMYRFWMARDTYQAISPVQSLCSALMVRHQLTTPRLVWSLFPCADPEFWAPHMEFIRAPRLTAMDFATGTRRFGVYAHDFRTESPPAWLVSLLAPR